MEMPRSSERELAAPKNIVKAGDRKSAPLHAPAKTSAGILQLRILRVSVDLDGDVWAIPVGAAGNGVYSCAGDHCVHSFQSDRYPRTVASAQDQRSLRSHRRCVLASARRRRTSTFSRVASADVGGRSAVTIRICSGVSWSGEGHRSQYQTRTFGGRSGASAVGRVVDRRRTFACVKIEQ